MYMLAALAACVLVLGLPRLLVACTNDEAGSHVEWRHAPGECCAHDHEHGASRGEDAPAGTPCTAPHDTCEHVDFAVELGPLPRGAQPAAPVPALVAVTPRHVATAPQKRPQFHAPATGPPRRDAPVRLRSTTLLRS